MKYETVENYAGGLFQTRTAERQDVISPLDGTVISQVPMSDTADVEEAVRHAHQAFPAWSSSALNSWKSQCLRQPIMPSGKVGCILSTLSRMPCK